MNDDGEMTKGRGGFSDDPMSGLAASVKHVQPYQATKVYLCPGCNNEIAVGVGHVVIVPLGRTEDRRHWHSACWTRRSIARGRN